MIIIMLHGMDRMSSVKRGEVMKIVGFLVGSFFLMVASLDVWSESKSGQAPTGNDAVLSGAAKLQDMGEGVWQVFFVHPVSGLAGSVRIDTNSEYSYGVVSLGDDERIYKKRDFYTFDSIFSVQQSAWVKFSKDEDKIDNVYIVYSKDGTMNTLDEHGNCNFRVLGSEVVFIEQEKKPVMIVGNCHVADWDNWW